MISFDTYQEAENFLTLKKDILEKEGIQIDEMRIIKQCINNKVVYLIYYFPSEGTIKEKIAKLVNLNKPFKDGVVSYTFDKPEDKTNGSNI